MHILIIVFCIFLEEYVFLNVIIPISTLRVQCLPRTSLKIALKRYFLTMGVSTLQVACAQLQATHAPGRSLLRGIALTACCCDPPLSSNRLRSGAVVGPLFLPN